jgi:hypothetical protein
MFGLTFAYLRGEIILNINTDTGFVVLATADSDSLHDHLSRT